MPRSPTRPDGAIVSSFLVIRPHIARNWISLGGADDTDCAIRALRFFVPRQVIAPNFFFDKVLQKPPEWWFNHLNWAVEWPPVLLGSRTSPTVPAKTDHHPVCSFDSSARGLELGYYRSNPSEEDLTWFRVARRHDLELRFLTSSSASADGMKHELRLRA